MDNQYYVIVQKTSNVNGKYSVETSMHRALSYLEKCIKLKFHCGNKHPFTHKEILKVLDTMNVEITDFNSQCIRMIVDSQPAGFETTMVTYHYLGKPKYLLLSSLRTEKCISSDDYSDIFAQILASNGLATDGVQIKYAVIAFPSTWFNRINASINLKTIGESGL